MTASRLYSFSCAKNILDHQQKQCAFPSILVILRTMTLKFLKKKLLL